MRRRDENFSDNGFEAWGGYMQAKISKLEEQFNVRNTHKLSNIFSGVSIYVNGFTIPSADELKELMSSHGGVYHTYQRNDDFIIASNLPDTKVKNMSLAKVVKPEWITDSITANKLLDYKQYLLYRNSRTQTQLNFCNNLKKDICNVKTDLDSETCTITKNDNIYTFESKFNDQTSNLSINTNVNKNENSKVQQPNIAKRSEIIKTAADPNFIAEFYNNSRLHHISQLGACFKQHVNDLRDNSSFIFPKREYLKEIITNSKTMSNSQLIFDKGKVIMHIDMDCFFVSVGLRTRPDLKGKPVAVTHSKGGQTSSKRAGVDRNTEFNLYRQKQAKKFSKTNDIYDDTEFESRVNGISDEGDKFGSMSEIASCSYEARAKGLHNGMFMGAALRLCPDLQTIPYDFEGYKEVAFKLYNTIAQYTLDIEAVSCDEMYVDCTELLKDLKVSVQDFATALRAEIREKSGCPCSTGFGGNRLQARLATKKAKPDGQFFLTADLVKDFMVKIKLKELPGVGQQTAHKLEALGHLTCGSLQSLSLTTLQHHFGAKTGAQLFDQCRGCDSNPLSFHTVRKSVSAEVNYGIRFENNDQCYEFLKQLCLEVHTRMQQFKVVGKCVTLKLMVRAEEAPVETAKFMGHGFCNVLNKSSTLGNATNDLDIISKEVISLCTKQNIDPKEMRGIGIQITKLESMNSQSSKGAISKFFTTNKNVTTECKSEIIKKKLDLDYHIKTEDMKVNTFASPKKPKIHFPKQKSPLLGSSKSPVRQRGRPPKVNKLGSTSQNLMSKFLQGQVKDTPYKDPMIKKNDNIEESKKSVTKEESKDSISHGLLGLPWQKVRELLRAWFESGQRPLPCDVVMIAEYMRAMVVNRKIDKLNILINFLKRRTREMDNQHWIEVYNQIIEQVQNAMLAVYGRRLYID